MTTPNTTAMDNTQLDQKDGTNEMESTFAKSIEHCLTMMNDARQYQ